MNPAIFIILDGAADSGKKTPLSEARKPNIDRLSEKSLCGLWQGAKAPAGYNPKSMSDVATMELLGYSYSDNPGRGYLEALGIGMKPSPRAICLRGNFSTAQRKGSGFEITDRRAGREEKGLELLSRKLSMKIRGASVKCFHSVGHRCVVVVDGRGLGADISDSDSKKGYSKITGNGRASERTAAILNEFSERAFEILENDRVNRKRKSPANFILLRGASRMKKVPQFRQKYGMSACSVSGVGIIKGISRYLGIRIIEVPGATGHLDTNIEGKARAAIRASRKFGFTILHINGCDEAGHDRNFEAKTRFIEKIDRLAIAMLARKKISMAITSDHQTSVRSGTHQFGPVPFMVYNCEKDISNGISGFSEKSCSAGIWTENPVATLKKALETGDE